MPAEVQHIQATTPFPYTNLDGRHGVHTVVCVPCDGRRIFASLLPKSKVLGGAREATTGNTGAPNGLFLKISVLQANFC